MCTHIYSYVYKEQSGQGRSSPISSFGALERVTQGMFFDLWKEMKINTCFLPLSLSLLKFVTL